MYFKILRQSQTEKMPARCAPRLVQRLPERQGKYAALSVYNTTATPIPRESMDKLFDRFYRTDPSRSSETGGHGIGLSIAKAVVSAHRGKITAETDDEQSLRITALLPLG